MEYRVYPKSEHLKIELKPPNTKNNCEMESERMI